jgi:hypothetical protein
METFVYVIAARVEGPVKIGFSNNPQKRLRQLQTGHPERLHLHHTQGFPAKRVKVMEKIIHHTISYLRQTGEWFDLSVEDAIAEVEFALIRYGDKEGLPPFMWK